MKKIRTNTLDILKNATGLSTLRDFENALLKGNIDSAENWLQYIVDNRTAFHLLSSGWDSWVRARELEIIKAKKKLALA